MKTTKHINKISTRKRECRASLKDWIPDQVRNDANTGWWIVIILMFLSSCAVVDTVSRETDTDFKSALLFEELIYDFGIAGPEQKIGHTFRFVNNGAVPIKITKVSTSCGCTAILSSEEEILPGEQGEIKTVLETLRHEGEQDAAIIVYSSDPDRLKTTLTMKGIIKTGIAVVPQGISFGNIQKGKTSEASVKVLQLSQDPLVLKKIDVNDRYFSVRTSEFREENSRGINVDIALKPEIPVGLLSEVITIHTNVNKFKKIDVPIIANILENK